MRGILLVLALLVPAASAAQPDFRGLWQMASADRVVKPGDEPDNLTPQAAAALARYRQDYDTVAVAPTNFCVPHGLPWIMASRARDYLIDIDQTDHRITMLFEGMDMHRLIHFTRDAVPAEFRPSTYGYSRARWEGEVLVIESSHLKALNPAGPFQRSDAATVTERWQIIQDASFGRALSIDIVVVDPKVFLKPSQGHQLLVPAAPGSVLNAYGCAESRWDDHIRQVAPRTAPRVGP